MEICKIFLVLFSSHLVLICTSFENEPRILIDVIGSFKTVTRLFLKICWKKHQMIQFITELNRKHSHFVSIIDNITEVKTTPGHAENILIVTDLVCPDSEDFLQQASARNKFRLPLQWILLDQNRSYKQDSANIIPAGVLATNISVNSEVALIQPLSNEEYGIYLVYKMNPKDVWRKELYGMWNSSHNFIKSIEMVQVAALRRNNLNGHEIKVVLVITNNDTIYHLADGLNTDDDILTRVNYRTTNHLLDFVNASGTFIYTDSWGYRYNSTWTGMTNCLAKKEADIGGTPMFITKERLVLVDFMSQPTPSRIRFIFRQPKLSFENNIYLLSFRSSLWYGSAAIMAILFLVLCLTTMWEWRENAKNETYNTNVGVLRPNVIDVALLIFGATCQQGSTVELKGTPGRVVLLLIFMALTFLYTSFSANIVALLQSSSSQIRTLEDLLSSRMRLGVEDTIYNRYFFSTETEPVRRAIYQTKIAPPGMKPNFMDINDGVREMRKGLFAFNMETGVGYKYVGKYFEESEKCDLMEISFVQDAYPWIPVKKHFAYIEIFKIGTKRVQEHGLQQREHLLLYKERPKCSERQVNFVSVGMVDFYPALLVLLYGALFAVMVLIIELLYHKKYKNGES